MKILSVNVGLPREVTWQGKVVTTGIFKEPIKGPGMLRRLNLDGDGRPISPFTAVRARRFMRIRRSTTPFGALNCPAWICPGVCSEKISRPRDYLRPRFTSGTDLGSATRKS